MRQLHAGGARVVRERQQQSGIGGIESGHATQYDTEP